MIDKGVIDIGGKRTEVGREDVRKLKDLLDELDVMYIIDDVTVGSPCDEAELTKEPADPKMWKVKNDAGIEPGDGFGRGGDLEFRELIIPYFFETDFMSLMQLDYEEAEFLGELLYGTGY